VSVLGLFRRPRVRYEAFGGIVSTESPPALVFVDRAWLRRTGRDGGAAWEGSPDTDRLSAPTEVHFAFTHHCTAGCDHCYTDSAESKRETLPLAEIARVADALARKGVFHVALGGGESTEDPRLLDIARLFRDRGIVPNLTTNGLHVDAAFARAAKVFGQVNVSMDGVGHRYGDARGYDGFAQADRALRLLRAEMREVGINCVVHRGNFDHLDELVAYAKGRRLNNVELLRMKPAGRGRERYTELRLTPDQRRAFYPRVLELARRHKIALHVDCSSTPFLTYHAPDAERMEKLGLFGCEGGNVLAAIDPAGRMSPCSFSDLYELDARDIEAGWSEAFSTFRNWPDRAPEPCDTCAYLRHCKGGCHVVAEFLTGDPGAPDPECPRVMDWQAGQVV